MVMLAILHESAPLLGRTLLMATSTSHPVASRRLSLPGPVV
jgi:hypothetical protein